MKFYSRELGEHYDRLIFYAPPPKGKRIHYNRCDELIGETQWQSDNLDIAKQNLPSVATHFMKLKFVLKSKTAMMEKLLRFANATLRERY